MKYKWKLITLVILVGLSFVSVYYFSGHTEQYSRYVFYPFQSARSTVLGPLPLSIGDILYFLGGIWLLVTLIRWVRCLLRFKTHKEQLFGSVITTINTLLFIYLFFFIGWGFNYDKEPLRKYWQLGNTIKGGATDSMQRRSKDSLALVAFDSFLVDRINTYAVNYRSLTFHAINERAKAYYRIYTDSKVKQKGLEVKSSIYSYFMELMAIDGYYNPFTGEGQVNANLPGFVLPFVICHEMAHQAGIAAEGDANLMAYALGTMPEDTSFRYSCYLNIWLYANSRLYHRDSIIAKSFENKLNKLTQAHLDTLDQISQKFNNTLTRYSGKIFDSYLKLQDQKEGIRSYGNVSSSAWQLEQKRWNEQQAPIKIP